MAAAVLVDARTRRGRLAGLRENGVCIFRGVPFAAAPVGRLRFRAPAASTPWSGVRDATRYAAAAPQNRGDPLAQLFEDRAPGCSEDCLTLNLWTPEVDGGRRPVMVWIHGGRFLRGSASETPFDGARLAKRGDVVVVTIQYRLGPFGFLHVNGGTPWISNLGLRDQIAALEWVREEIASFGGDPGNVTIFGQSAGAISAGTLLCSPAADGLFHRAALQSGPPLGLDPGVATPVAETLLRSLHVREPHELQHLPAEAFLAVEGSCHASPGNRPLGLPYMPVIDGELLPRDPLDVHRAGAGARVPLLIGSTRDEMTVYLLLDPQLLGLDETALRRRVADLIGDADAAEHAIDVYRRARLERGESAEPRDLWFALLADCRVRHPSMRLAEQNGAFSPDTFAYRFDWVSPVMEGALGACHALDVPFVFGTLADPQLGRFAGCGAEAMALSEFLQDSWIRFARSGCPGPEWPRYDASRRQTLLLSSECRVEAAPAESERSFWDRLRA